MIEIFESCFSQACEVSSKGARTKGFVWQSFLILWVCWTWEVSWTSNTAGYTKQPVYITTSGCFFRDSYVEPSYLRKKKLGDIFIVMVVSRDSRNKTLLTPCILMHSLILTLNPQHTHTHLQASPEGCRRSKTAFSVVIFAQHLHWTCPTCLIQPNCTDMFGHDCACLTCKTYRNPLILLPQGASFF